jgi:hypothetical protein
MATIAERLGPAVVRGEWNPPDHPSVEQDPKDPPTEEVEEDA